MTGELHTRDGYGLCCVCTAYSDNGRDVEAPVPWPCPAVHRCRADEIAADGESA